MRLPLRADAVNRVADRCPVAGHAARVHRAVLALDFPALDPLSLGVDHQVVGPCLRRPVGVGVANLREVGRVHDVLVDVVAAGQDAHLVELPDLIRRHAIRPEDSLDARPFQLAGDRDSVVVPAPDVDRTDEPVDGRVLGPLLPRVLNSPCSWAYLRYRLAIST